MLYFLNLPRVGGTSMYKMSQDVLTFKSNVMNGNWMNDTNTNRVGFWEWEKKTQLEHFQDVTTIFNEINV